VPQVQVHCLGFVLETLCPAQAGATLNRDDSMERAGCLPQQPMARHLTKEVTDHFEVDAPSNLPSNHLLTIFGFFIPLAAQKPSFLI
jgi:hypothetical protein